MNARRKLFFFGKGGAPVLWTPSQIHSDQLLSWVDSSSLENTLDDDRVVKLEDLTGNGNGFVQNSAALQYNYDSLKKCIVSDGSKYMLGEKPFGNSQRIAFFQVNQFLGTDVAFQYCVTTVAADLRYFVRKRAQGNVFQFESTAGGSGDDYANTPGDNLHHIFEQQKNDSISEAFIDSIKTGQSNIDHNINNPRWILGAFQIRNDPDPRHVGDFNEAIVLDQDPDLATTQKIQGYLAWKWDNINPANNLVAKLPANHPYKNGAPTL